MAGEVVKITGLEDVQRMLTTAPKNIVLLGYGKALKAGIDVIAEAVIGRVPVETGELASAAVTEVVVDANGKGGAASMGFGKQGSKANWLEYGHRQVGHKPKKKDLGTVKPHPFMRAAADSAAEPAITAFAESLAGTVKQEYK